MAMDDEHFEIPSGTIDGFNDTFTSSSSYQSLTLHVWYNGRLLLASSANGWDETGSNQFTMKIPPLIGDIIVCRYLEA
jgi:hypothetical protein